MGELNQVADGVWVRQSEWVWTNSIVVRAEDGLILVDPGIHGSELSGLADDLDRLGTPVVAGFSTHPHWDHLLWHPRFGDVPRYATAAAAGFAEETREQQREGPAEDGAVDVPLDLVALVTPLPGDGGPVPGEIIEHRAHAVGHAAVLLADRGVLLAGDMLSDVLIPLFDPRQDDQPAAYETALDRLGEAASHVDVLVPGHGAVAEGPEVATRLTADRAYIDALRRGEEPADTRLGPDATWLHDIHQSNQEVGPAHIRMNLGYELSESGGRNQCGGPESPGDSPIPHKARPEPDRHPRKVAEGYSVSSRLPRFPTITATGGMTAATTLITTAAVVDQRRTTFHARRIRPRQTPISVK